MPRKKDNKVTSDLSSDHLLLIGKNSSPGGASTGSSTLSNSDDNHPTDSNDNHQTNSNSNSKEWAQPSPSASSNPSMNVDTHLHPVAKNKQLSSVSASKSKALTHSKTEISLPDQRGQAASGGVLSNNGPPISVTPQMMLRQRNEAGSVLDGNSLPNSDPSDQGVESVDVQYTGISDAKVKDGHSIEDLIQNTNSDDNNNNDNAGTHHSQNQGAVVRLGAKSKTPKLKPDPLLDLYSKAVNKSECMKVSCTLAPEDATDIDYFQRLTKSSLQQAIQKCETRMVKHLVKHHDASVQWNDEQDGSSILHYTAKLSNKHAPFVKLLMGRMDKSWLLRENHKGHSPIIVAIEYGGVELVLEMLKWIDTGFEIDGNDKDPIDLAMNRQLEDGLPILQCLVEKRLVDLKKGENGNTAAHRAAFRWYADALEIFLNADHSLAFDKSDDDGATPLLKVAMNSSKEKTSDSVRCADMLVSICGANVNATARSLHGWGPLHVGVEHGNYKLIDFLVKQKRIDVDPYDDTGKTPLMHSMAQEKLNIARLLLQKGKANPNLHQLGPDGQELGNCVDIVAQKGHPDLMKLLLGQPGIEIDEKNEKGDTPMHTVIHKCSFTTSVMITEQYRQTGILLAGRADEVIDIHDNLGRTPIHLAIQTEGTYSIIKRMLGSCTKAKSVIDEKDEYGYTPLHLAVEKSSSTSRLALIQLLLQYDASLSVANDGKSPLHIALEQRDEEAVTILVQHKDVWKLVDQDVLHDMVVNMPHLLVGGLDANINGVYDKMQYKLSASDETRSDTPDKIHLNGSAIVDKIYVPKEGELTLHDSSIRQKKDPTKKERKSNNHLRLLVEAGHDEVCVHPALRAVLRNKWKVASIIYFSYLIWYMAYVFCVSGYMISANPPYNVSQNHTCEASSWKIVNGDTLPLLPGWIIGASLFGLGMEILQIIHSGIEEVLTLLNMSDWVTFISAIIMVLDFDGCQVHPEWQFVLGTFCVFMAWLNLLFYLRKLPELGIYVVMIGMVLITFCKVFMVFFLFILAFAICFTLLLGNQFPFRNTGYSLVKTWVMMIGELDFDTIFHSYHEDDSPETQLYFDKATYCLFAGFLIIMSLIIMNLLTGLAVSDVSLLQEDSMRSMRIMKMNTCLDVEEAMPLGLRMKLYKSDLILHVEKESNAKTVIFTFFDNLYYGELSIESIRNDAMAILKRQMKGKTEEAEESQAEQIEELKNRVDELDHKIGAAVSEIRDMTMGLNTFLAAHPKL